MTAIHEQHDEVGELSGAGLGDCWGLIGEDARRILAATADQRAALQRAVDAVQRDVSFGITPEDVERAQRAATAGIDMEGLRRAVAAVERDMEKIRVPPELSTVLNRISAESQSVTLAHEPARKERAAPARIAAAAPTPRPDDHLVALSDLIDEIQDAKIRNPRTLRTFGAAAIYKGVQHELRRRRRGERADRASLYGVIADAFDPATKKYKKARFAKGLMALAERRAAADGVLAEAKSIAAVESRWNTERSGRGR